MALRKILTEPDKILREKSLKVDQVDKNLQNLITSCFSSFLGTFGLQ